MKCPKCNATYDAADNAKIGGNPPFIEIQVTCPECGHGLYTSIVESELIDDPNN